jgi:hypothetical protein
MSPKALHRPLLLSAVLIASAAGLAACGGSSSSSATASSSSSSDTARLKFTQCLRDNGVNIPTNPGQSGGGPPNINRAQMQTALKACQKYRGALGGTITPAQRQQFQEAFLKFQACMSQHGVDLPSRPAGGGPPTGGQQINRNSPTFQAAAKACQSQLPQRSGGGGGPGFFGGGGQ